MAFDLKDNWAKNNLIRYLDDEEDKVVLSNSFDYEQVLIFMEKSDNDFLKINIENNYFIGDLKISYLEYSQIISESKQDNY